MISIGRTHQQYKNIDNNQIYTYIYNHVYNESNMRKELDVIQLKRLRITQLLDDETFVNTKHFPLVIMCHLYFTRNIMCAIALYETERK